MGRLSASEQELRCSGDDGYDDDDDTVIITVFIIRPVPVTTHPVRSPTSNSEVKDAGSFVPSPTCTVP
jgi:hypothetical protein